MVLQLLHGVAAALCCFACTLLSNAWGVVMTVSAVPRHLAPMQQHGEPTVCHVTVCALDHTFGMSRPYEDVCLVLLRVTNAYVRVCVQRLWPNVPAVCNGYYHECEQQP